MEKFEALSTESKVLYAMMIAEAEYDSGNEEDFNQALMKFTPAQRGNLTDLKKKGLVSTCDDPDVPGYLWVVFDDVETALAVEAMMKG